MCDQAVSQCANVMQKWAMAHRLLAGGLSPLATNVLLSLTLPATGAVDLLDTNFAVAVIWLHLPSIYRYRAASVRLVKRRIQLGCRTMANLQGIQALACGIEDLAKSRDYSGIVRARLQLKAALSSGVKVQRQQAAGLNASTP